jgi:hypothetical protein
MLTSAFRTAALDCELRIKVSVDSSRPLAPLSYQTASNTVRRSLHGWQSPLTTYWPGDQARTCLESPVQALGRMLRSWIGTFFNADNEQIPLTDDIQQRRQYLRQTIEHYIGVKIRVASPETAMLACCQWATRIMLSVEQNGVPIGIAAEHTTMQPRLVMCLRMTDLSTLWGRDRGMLFWVVSICHRATLGRCFPLLTTALMARFSHIMALSDQYQAISLSPMGRSDLFESICCHT